MSDYVLYAWRRYLYQLQHNPVPAKGITTGVVFAASELTAQKLQHRQDINLRRLIGMILYGLLYLGPYMHIFHKSMDKLFKGKRDLWTVIRKVVIEQLTSGPLNNFLYLIFSNLILEGQSLSVTQAKVRNGFITVQKRSWMIWPLVSFINNMFVPLQFRVLVGNVTAYLWSVYLIRQATAKKSIQSRTPKEERKEL